LQSTKPLPATSQPAAPLPMGGNEKLNCNFLQFIPHICS
jgi:hypothetical protein